MCVPQTLAALQAMQAVQQVISKKEALKQQEKEAQQNIQIAQQNAQEERRRGLLQSNQSKVETAQLISQKRNALAAAGIAAEDGTASDILKDTQTQNDILRNENLRSSNKRANQYEQQAAHERESLSYNNRKGQLDLTSQGTTLLTRRFNTFSKRGLLQF